MKKIYVLENLGCANCAAKIEKAVSELPQVNSAELAFMTKKLKVELTEDVKDFERTVSDIANGIESGIVVRETKAVKAVRRAVNDVEHSHTHEHEEHGCCGGHEHSHEHGFCGENEHTHEHECCGEHEHSHEHGGSGIVNTYLLENLGCANCAAKIEKLISELPEVENANITFMTKKLKVSLKTEQRDFESKVSQIANSVENGIIVKNLTDGRKKERGEHIPGDENCECVVCETQRTAADNKRNRDLNEKKRERLGLAILGLGVSIFAAGLALAHFGMLTGYSELAVMLTAYLILGLPVIKKALKGIARGEIFDENFLMSIATIGAFIIGEYPEGVGVMLFYRIGEYFEERAVERSRNQIMDVIDLRPESVVIYENGKEKLIAAEKVEVGATVVVKPGVRIPLDGVVIEGESRIDTSAVTGEFVPVRAGKGSQVISGGINTSGLLKIRVTQTLENSMVSRIMESVEEAAGSKPKIDKFITRFAKIYTPIVVFLAVLIALIPSVLTGDWHRWVYSALTFLVISCPCAIVLSVPLAFFAGIGGATKKGILFKGGMVLEALKDIKMVVMDKTGTITKGEFALKEMKYTGNLLRALSATNNGAINKETAERFLLYMVASSEQASNHPVALSIVQAARDAKIELVRPEKLEEIAGKGIRASIDGVDILCGNAALMKQFKVDMTGFEDVNRDGYTVTLVAIDGEFAGALLITDGLKADSAEAISKLSSMKIDTAMLTGDNKANAEAVAAAVGIKRVFAGLLPNEKLDALKKFRAEAGSVMFVGDGINDAPVLAGADVGAAMGSGADAALEAADVVFLNSNLSSVPQAIDMARATNRIAVQNIVVALVIKIIFLALGFFGMVNMWIAVFADSGVAIACVLNSVRLLYRKYDAGRQ